jgi:G:T-mismatch repair DNA endonuclease (very short patch repair protein)
MIPRKTHVPVIVLDRMAEGEQFELFGFEHGCFWKRFHYKPENFKATFPEFDKIHVFRSRLVIIHLN